MNKQPGISGKTNNHVYGVGKGLCELRETSHVDTRPHSLTYTRQHEPGMINDTDLGLRAGRGAGWEYLQARVSGLLNYKKSNQLIQ